MDTSLWHTNPTAAYADWQAREAAGADRRPFSARSIVQHRAMFEHFRRHLLERGATLASFSPEHIAAPWHTPAGARHGVATRMRYLKLLDRLCRHLVAIGVRQTNPAAPLVREAHWPESEQNRSSCPRPPTPASRPGCNPLPPTTFHSCAAGPSWPCFSVPGLPWPRGARPWWATCTQRPRRPICAYRPTAPGTPAPSTSRPSPCRSSRHGRNAAPRCPSPATSSSRCRPTARP
ncbi:hypothetical protein CNECB9_1260010 [Cupriavidus necator]|uniref:Integrase/recombinase n=1 Tax=Cupriavidus necator TaxID=106590 RepID=A0A1K0I8S5_CUPNE|nr:hypothetical protein CNECB9_1260010 [Cupriavidus necator]